MHCVGHSMGRTTARRQLTSATPQALQAAWRIPSHACAGANKAGPPHHRCRQLGWGLACVFSPRPCESSQGCSIPF
jgi:hypothetical protein